MAERAPFNPSDYLTDLRGRAYLEVKFRLLWVHDYVDRHGYRLDIQSELVRDEPDYACFRAHVRIMDENGVVVKAATDYGQEERQDFGDFLEKASTKAIGRALALCGFGTQFCEEFEFGADEGRVVDAPVERSSTQYVAPPSPTTSSSGGRAGRSAVVTNIGNRSGQDASITPRQEGYLTSLLNEYGQRTGENVLEHLSLVPTLSRQTASTWVGQLSEDKVLPALPKATGATG